MRKSSPRSRGPGSPSRHVDSSEHSTPRATIRRPRAAAPGTASPATSSFGPRGRAAPLGAWRVPTAAMRRHQYRFLTRRTNRSLTTLRVNVMTNSRRPTKNRLERRAAAGDLVGAGGERRHRAGHRLARVAAGSSVNASRRSRRRRSPRPSSRRSRGRARRSARRRSRRRRPGTRPAGSWSLRAPRPYDASRRALGHRMQRVLGDRRHQRDRRGSRRRSPPPPG